MSIQTEQHKCEQMPEYTHVLRHRIDGRYTEWEASFSATSREGYMSSTMYVRYCPWCGEALDDGR